MSNIINNRFIPVFHPHDSIQAELINSTLEQAGIVCYVNNGNLTSIYMGSIGIGAFSMVIMVPENMKELAEEIIKKLELE